MAMRMRISLTCVPMAISNRRSSKTSCRANTFLSYYDNHHNHHNNWLNHLKYLCHLRDDQLGKIHSRIVTGVDHLEIHRKPCDDDDDDHYTAHAPQKSLHTLASDDLTFSDCSFSYIWEYIHRTELPACSIYIRIYKYILSNISPPQFLFHRQ